MVLLLGGVPAVGSAAPFSALYVFGDSLSDTGNLAIAAGGHPLGPVYDPHRFTNRAPVGVEILATALGLSAVPFLGGGGTNFAFAGSLTGDGGLAPGLASQVGMFASTLGPSGADQNALYFVWSGGNDLLGTLTGPASALSVPNGGPQNITTALELLYGMGARNFYVPNLPNVGRTPMAIAGGPEAIAGGTVISGLFNQELAARLTEFQLTRPDTTVLQFDTYAYLERLLNSAGALGFTNTTGQCVTGPALAWGELLPGCDPEGFVFWDGMHPTARTHELFGAALAQAAVPPSQTPVPEPATLALMALGLGVGAAARRARGQGGSVGIHRTSGR
jgi:outer membrane lipase/esterase